MSVLTGVFKKTGMKSVLQSKPLLYFLVFIAFFDFIFLSLEKDFIFAGVFIIIGFLTSFFNKNMIVILFTTIILTNILRFGKDVRVHEGMEDVEANIDPKDPENFEENMADPTDSIEYIEPEPGSDTSLTKKTPASHSPTTNTPKIAPVPADNFNNKLTKFASPSGDYSADNIQSLLENQKQIMQNMNDLAPLLKQAETFMSSPVK